MGSKKQHGQSSQSPAQDCCVVGIAGGSASGKTTLAQKLAEHWGNRILLIAHDRYYLDVADPSSYNYDHPQALDTALLVDHLVKLQAGQSVELPFYDFRTHRRQPIGETVLPRPLIVVEGILILAEPVLRNLFDFSVFVHADEDIRLARRLSRDTTSRGRKRESVLEQYFATVHPMHCKFVEPSRSHAQLVVSGESPLEQALGQILDSLTSWGCVVKTVAD